MKWKLEQYCFTKKRKENCTIIAIVYRPHLRHSHCLNLSSLRYVDSSHTNLCCLIPSNLPLDPPHRHRVSVPFPSLESFLMPIRIPNSWKKFRAMPIQKRT